MEKEKLLEELKIEFNKLEKNNNVDLGFIKLDKYFGISDMVLQDDFVSTNLDRAICRRILDNCNGWIQFCHTHLMPTPGNMLQMEEAKITDEKDKLALNELMYKLMELSSRNALNGLNNDKQGNLDLIQDATLIWEEEILLKLVPYFTKLNMLWKNKKLETEILVKKDYNGVY